VVVTDANVGAWVGACVVSNVGGLVVGDVGCGWNVGVLVGVRVSILGGTLLDGVGLNTEGLNDC